MSRFSIERKLADVTQRLKQARVDLGVLDEQRAALAEEADDLKVRAVVAEHKAADREYRDAQRHVDAMDRSRIELAKHIADLQRSQDELLDRLVPDPL